MNNLNRALSACMALAVLAFSLSAHAGIDLDGNAVDSSGTDWETRSGSVADTGIIPDVVNDRVLTGGQTKDKNDLDKWKTKSAGNADSDKTNITNAYAAAYKVGDDIILYFGADRFANDGDASIGYWFYQDNNVAELNNGFSGTHLNGDLFVETQFNGDGTVDVIVYAWCDLGAAGNVYGVNCASNSTLVQLGAGSKCAGNSDFPDGNACAISNESGLTTAPWPYLSKNGNTDFPVNSFFEGGINLTQFGITGCFSTFLARTRSSTAINATLKDYVLDNFGLCGYGTIETCGTTRLASYSEPGNTANRIYATEASFTVKNAGGAGWPANTTITAAFSVDTNSVEVAPNPLPVCGTAPCNPEATTELVDGSLRLTIGAGGLASGGERLFNATLYSDQNPPSYTATATVRLPDANGLPDPDNGTPLAEITDLPGSNQCTAGSFSKELFATKDCVGQLDENGQSLKNDGIRLVDMGTHIAVVTDVRIKVCNTGEYPVAITSITDSPDPIEEAANWVLPTLDAGDLCDSSADCTASCNSGYCSHDATLSCNGDSDCVPECIGADTATGKQGVCESDTGNIRGTEVCATFEGTIIPSDLPSSVDSRVPKGTAFTDTVTIEGEVDLGEAGTTSIVPVDASTTCTVCCTGADCQ